MSDESLRWAVTRTLASGKAVELVGHVLSESTLTSQEYMTVYTALEGARIRGECRAIRKNRADECSKCGGTETSEWYRSIGKELVCQDCYTDRYDL